jgi:hypothetical protein
VIDRFKKGSQTMADRERPVPGKPPHPGNHPRTMTSGRNTTTRWIGMVLGAIVLVVLLWWLFAGSTTTPGQEHTQGEPAGVGTTAVPEQEAGAVDPAADRDDPQAAIGPDPFTEPTSPAAAEQQDAPTATNN